MAHAYAPLHQKVSCPYWVFQANNQCTLYKGGVFLPLEEHVARYCCSSVYQHCPQYQRGCANLEDAARKHGLSLADSRRHHARLTTKIPLRLYACDQQGQTVTLLSDQAQTVDLSVGGLGMLSVEELQAGQEVAVHFDGGFSIPGLSSRGEIRWCRSRGAEYFQAGIAFAEGSPMGKVVATMWGAEH